jgi:hypothetical protein
MTGLLNTNTQDTGIGPDQWQQAFDGLVNHGAVPPGIDVNVRNSQGETLLMRLAFDGHLEAVDRLIKAGADLDAQSNWGETALMRAASQRHSHITDRLEQAGANPEIINDALFQARDYMGEPSDNTLLTGIRHDRMKTIGLTQAVILNRLLSVAEHQGIETVINRTPEGAIAFNALKTALAGPHKESVPVYDRLRSDPTGCIIRMRESYAKNREMFIARCGGEEAVSPAILDQLPAHRPSELAQMQLRTSNTL